jgi:hypothetical protein
MAFGQKDPQQMRRDNRKYLLALLLPALLVAVGVEHGAWTAFAVGIFFGKIYVLINWVEKKSVSLLVLYLTLFAALAGMTHIYVALLGLGLFVIPWAVIHFAKALD